jgi:hypothetical protein
LRFYRGNALAIAKTRSTNPPETMKVALLKLLVASILVGILLAATVVAFARGRTVSSSLRLGGAGCLVVVVLAHAAETLRLFPGMHWGDPHSIGHYVDLTSAVLGITLLFLGSYLYQASR